MLKERKMLKPVITDEILSNNRKMLSPLTSRELEILAFVATGDTNAQISEKLFISRHTVKAHICNILLKLCAKDRTNAAIIAYKLGLCE